MPPNLTPTPAFEIDDSDEGGLELGQIIGALRRQWLLIVGATVSVATAATMKALNDVPVYESKFEILTQPITIESKVISSVSETLTSQQDAPAQIGVAQLAVLKSPQVIDPIVTELQAKYPQTNYGEIVSSLKVQPAGDILEVSYAHTDSELVSDVLDLVSDAFLEYSLEERLSDIRQGIEFVEEQLPQLRDRVELQQERLQRLRQEHNLVDPATRGGQLTTQAGNLEQQRLDIQLQLEEAKALYEDLQQELTSPAIETASSSVLSGNARYQELLSQLQTLDREIAIESATFLATSPEIQRLQEQRQNLIPLLRREGERVLRELETQIRELLDRDRTLAAEIDRLNAEIKQLSGVAREYTDIQRELDIATQNLNEFLAKREAFRIDAAQEQVPWQLISEPGKPRPSSASAKKNAVMGAALGLFLGMGLALLVDRLRNVIYTSKEVKSISRLPLLGIIPLDKTLSLEAQLSSEEKRDRHWRLSSPAFEAFCSLYTNVRLLNPDTPVRSLTVSSPSLGDGKSTVAIHLAQAAAAMGQRVLLVDTDLRHPSLHIRLGLANTRGLTDAIADSHLDVWEAIEQSSLETNLFVLPAGPIPIDPPRLLASQKMQVLMEQLQSAFELVVYDSPIVLGLSDTHLLAARTQGVVFVTGLGHLKRPFFEQALEELKSSGTPLLGVVANRDREPPSESSTFYKRYATERVIGERTETADERESRPVLSFLKKIKGE
ncbi:polysaccharide biosynthesis tyrosine autokinase [Geitlerinema sp. CS-897]|nr:polysaccharide biosynthesis tyrosine autokinase [Geitlerinema sp. CS-897]